MGRLALAMELTASDMATVNMSSGRGFMEDLRGERGSERDLGSKKSDAPAKEKASAKAGPGHEFTAGRPALHDQPGKRSPGKLRMG